MRTRPSRGALVAAQLSILHALVAGLDPPFVGRVRRALLGDPRVDDSPIGGVPSTVFRPARGHGPWPAVLVFSGATRRGRMHPAFQRIGTALAATGHLAVVSEPTGVSIGELQPRTLDDALATARELATAPEVREGRIALAGPSVGAMLALLVAADRELAERIRVVTALAPCCDVDLTVRVITTDTYVSDGEILPFVPGGFSRLVIARSLAASLPEGADRDELRGVLLGIPDDAAEPLAVLRARGGSELGESARAVVELLGNTDPERFSGLYAALPESLRAAVTRISPISTAAQVRVPVEIIVAREDKYLPLADAEAFAVACPTARLTVLDSLAHAVPRASIGEARDLVRLDAALVRALARMRDRAYSGR